MINVPRSIRLTSGKGDFIKRVLPANGRVVDICLLEWNVDLSNGCIAQVSAAHLDEVVQNNGLYLPPDNFDIYKKDGTGDKRCDYCYAWSKNSGSVIPYKVDEKTRADFETARPKFLRFGKNTEPGHPYYFEAFSKLIDLCKEFGTIPIITTKMLPFGIEGARETKKYAENGSDSYFRLSEEKKIPSGKELAKMLRDTNTSLLVSLGYDEIEQGPLLQGCSNEWRIEQAVNYHIEKVNTSLTVVCDVTSSLEENVSRGSFIGRALNERTRTGINVRVIPARLYTHKTIMQIAGSKRSVLTDTGYHNTPQFDQVSDNKPVSQARYVAKGAFKLIPNYVHPDFKGLFVEGMGVCGVVEEMENCDKCNCYGKTRIQFPESQLPKIQFSSPTRRKLFVDRQKINKVKNIPLLPNFSMPKKKT